MKKSTSRKWLAVLMTFIVILSCSSMVLAAGLTKGSDNRYHYVQDNGSYLKNSWKKIGDYWYYFDGNGNMVVGWKTISGKRYYFNTAGKMVTGWATISGSRYYFDKSGVMATGTKTVDGKVRQFGTDGKATTGWKTVDGKKYYYTDGAYATGWKTIGGYAYYFGNDGGMRTGWQVINGKTYFFYKSGDKTSTPTDSYNLYVDYGRCQSQPVGSAVISKFCIINGYWYYFLEDGSRATNTVIDADAGLRAFDKNGHMLFGEEFKKNGIVYSYVGFGKYLPVGYEYGLR